MSQNAWRPGLERGDHADGGAGNRELAVFADHLPAFHVLDRRLRKARIDAGEQHRLVIAFGARTRRRKRRVAAPAPAAACRKWRRSNAPATGPRSMSQAVDGSVCALMDVRSLSAGELSSTPDAVHKRTAERDTATGWPRRCARSTARRRAPACGPVLGVERFELDTFSGLALEFLDHHLAALGLDHDSVAARTGDAGETMMTSPSR